MAVKTWDTVCMLAEVRLCLFADRDFAYVARDRGTRRHMCHVFRCELPARHIANTLCEICKKVIAQRATQAGNGSGQKARPSDLPNLHRIGTGMGDSTVKFENLLKSECFLCSYYYYFVVIKDF